MRAAAGLKLALLPEHVIAPGTIVVPCFSTNDDEETVAEFMASLKLTDGLMLVGTPEEFAAGVTDRTVGGVTSARATVVKVQV